MAEVLTDAPAKGKNLRGDIYELWEFDFKDDHFIAVTLNYDSDWLFYGRRKYELFDTYSGYNVFICTIDLDDHLEDKHMKTCPECGSEVDHEREFDIAFCKKCHWNSTLTDYDDEADDLTEKEKIRLTSKYSEKRYIP